MFVIRSLQLSLEKEVKRDGCGRPVILVQYMDSAACRPSAARCTEAVRRPAPLRSVCRKSTRKRNLFPFDETVSGRTCVKTGPLRTRLCGPATL